MIGSIANAFHGATEVRQFELPNTPSRVLEAIEAKREAKEGDEGGFDAACGSERPLS